MRACLGIADPSGSPSHIVIGVGDLLFGLLRCGHCGGNLTVAGSANATRYYCANAKEKGPAVCEGMPGLLETRAAEVILGLLKC
jgi:site-specific DNA recombinase